jgi:hypothetical protein
MYIYIKTSYQSVNDMIRKVQGKVLAYHATLNEENSEN